jgi:hypothetical protein
MNREQFLQLCAAADVEMGDAGFILGAVVVNDPPQTDPSSFDE